MILEDQKNVTTRHLSVQIPTFTWMFHNSTIAYGNVNVHYIFLNINQ